MSSRIPSLRRFACLATALTLFGSLTVLSAPAQADHDDEHLVKVSSWCGKSVRFTNLSSDEIDVSWEIVVPLSPFPSKVGEFSLDSHETYTLQAYGGQKGGPVHRLYYKAESDDYEQEGYVDQYKYCKKPLVKISVQCGYVTFTNVFNHKVTVRYQQGHDYGGWDEDFWFYPTQYKQVEFDSKVLWYSAESRWGDHYRRQVGTVYQPKKCDEYEDYAKKHDDDDDDDEFELHDAGDFILKVIPFSPGPLFG